MSYWPSSQACNEMCGSVPIPVADTLALQTYLTAVESSVDAANHAVFDYSTPTAGLPAYVQDQIASAAPMAVRVSSFKSALATPSGLLTATQSAAATGSNYGANAIACGSDGIPEVIPLAGSGAAPYPVATTPAPVKASPVQQAPAVTAPLQAVNLCWALRQGTILQSQFSAGDFAKLAIACNQKGYRGTCPPPGSWAAYLNAGNLPRLSVSDADLAAVPTVDLTGKTCNGTLAQAGLAGLPEWGGAAVAGSGAAAEGTWFASHKGLVGAVLLLAAAGIMSQSSKRRA